MKMNSLFNLIWVNLTLFLIVFNIVECTFSSAENDYDSCTIIEGVGFKCERHNVTTSDGYILSIFRVVNDHSTRNKKPVLLIHGLISSGDTWISNFKDFPDEKQFMHFDQEDFEEYENFTVSNNLGFALADANYDVWIFNARGNLYSRNHVTLDPDEDRKFWNFTFEQIIKYDVPQTIDYILNTTCKRSISLIGHSMGGAVVIAVLTDPQMDPKINGAIAMAPGVYINELLSKFLQITPIPKTFEIGLKSTIVPAEIFSNTGIIKTTLSTICDRLDVMCKDMTFFMGNANKTVMQLRLRSFPGGASAKTFLHFMKNAQNRAFAKFRHLTESIIESINPFKKPQKPEYDFEKVNTTKLAIFYSDGDKLITSESVEKLRRKFNDSLLDFYKVPAADFAHGDYMGSPRAGELINKRVLKLLKGFN